MWRPSFQTQSSARRRQCSSPRGGAEGPTLSGAIRRAALCFSKDTCEGADRNLVTLQAGMVPAFDEDADEHRNRDDLIAYGTVERSPTLGTYLHLPRIWYTVPEGI